MMLLIKNHRETINVDDFLMFLSECDTCRAAIYVALLVETCWFKTESCKKTEKYL